MNITLIIIAIIIVVAILAFLFLGSPRLSTQLSEFSLTGLPTTGNVVDAASALPQKIGDAAETNPFEKINPFSYRNPFE